MIIRAFSPMHKKSIVAGELVNGVFTKNCKPYHKMIIEKGYGISESVIQQLVTYNCHTIIIKVNGAEVTRTSLDELLKMPIKTYQRDKQRFIKSSR